MKIEQSFKYKDQNGEIKSKTLELEFREIDRFRKSDAPLFFKAVNLLDDGEFTGASVEKMEGTFIDALIVSQTNRTDLTLLKNDVVALWELNLKLLTRLVVPFLTSNLKS